MDDTLRVDSRTDVPITDFGSQGYFLWKTGARGPNLEDYQTGTSITHGNSAFPVLFDILIKDNFTILRFEDSGDNSRIAATLDTQVPIAGYKRYMVTFPARADIGTYVPIVSEGQAEKYSFTADLVINRNNLSTNLQNSIAGGSVPSGSTGTDAHSRFISDLTYSLVEQYVWGSVHNHPNYKPYNFHRLAAAFWGEDNRVSITNNFEDITGVTFSLAQTNGGTSASFGASTNWSGYRSYYSNELVVGNSSTGTHGGAELFTGDFVNWYAGRFVLPSVGVTRIAQSAPSSVTLIRLSVLK